MLCTAVGCLIGLLCGMGNADVGYEIQVSAIGEGLYVDADVDGTVILSDEPIVVAEQSTEETAAEETVPAEA